MVLIPTHTLKRGSHLKTDPPSSSNLPSQPPDLKQLFPTTEARSLNSRCASAWWKMKTLKFSPFTSRRLGPWVEVMSRRLTAKPQKSSLDFWIGRDICNILKEICWRSCYYGNIVLHFKDLPRPSPWFLEWRGGRYREWLAYVDFSTWANQESIISGQME